MKKVLFFVSLIVLTWLSNPLLAIAETIYTTEYSCYATIGDWGKVYKGRLKGVILSYNPYVTFTDSNGEEINTNLPCIFIKKATYTANTVNKNYKQELQKLNNKYTEN